MVARQLYPILGIALAACLTACQSEGQEESAGGTQTAAESPADPGLVEVIAADYAFEAPEEIPSGWVTFRMTNRGQEHHFLLLNRLPEGRTFDDYREQVVTPFDTVWHALLTGAVDRAAAGQMLGELLPDWYASVKQMGGPGLLAPGRVVETTVNLDPGVYVMECYVKTADGTFHTSLGMQRQLIVTEASSGLSAPEPDLEITLSNFEIAVSGAATRGTQTVAVQFEEHPEIGLGNDVHVVRLDDGKAADEVVPWMDWMNLDGLRAPAPATFVGGTQEMPVGHTAYFTVELEPGRFAWISESTADRGMVKEFSVE